MHLVSYSVVLTVVLIGWFISWYLDTPLPEDMQEKWKVRVIDATMRTFGHISTALITLGVMEPFSSLHRDLADVFVIVMTTGRAWIETSDPALKITTLTTDKNKITMRMYEPLSTKDYTNRPALVYFHGGGFSLLSIDSYDAFTRKLARDSGIVTVSVNYRLSPQYPYPIPLDDCREAINYIISNAGKLHLDVKRIAVGGDSAGGNLAASISLSMSQLIKLQLLLMPVMQFFTLNTTSVLENRRFFSSTTNSLSQVTFWMNYLGCCHEFVSDIIVNNHTSLALKKSKFASYVNQEIWLNRRFISKELSGKDLSQQIDFGRNDIPLEMTTKMTDPNVCPLMADEETLSKVPMAFVMTAGYDIIRDDGIMYAERLKRAGISTYFVNHPLTFHNVLFFLEGPLQLQIAKQAFQDIVSYIKITI